MISYSVAEYAALVIGVVQLCAVGRNTSTDPKKNLSGNYHAQRGRNKIDPKRVPVTGVECGAKCLCGIHAHPG